MSWTVPQGCYYACKQYDTTYYYGAGQTVPSGREPHAGYNVLVDFSNGYIYTSWMKCTINIKSNNTFTVSSSVVQMTSDYLIVASSRALDNLEITLAGESFSFGDGTGLFSKTALGGLNGDSYDGTYSFSGRSDIVTARFPQGIDVVTRMYANCTSLVSSEALPSVTRLSGLFSGCTSLVTAPSIPNSVIGLSNCFRNCTQLKTPPNIPSSVTDMWYCFYGCSQLATSPEIPASVADMRGCFSSCTALQGNIVVYNNPSYYGDAFSSISNDVYILNGAGTSEVATTWRTIANGYSNVHYEADDNQIPSLSFTATRVSGMASEVPSENGEYAFINATAIVYETYLPDGWSCNYDEGGESLTNDSVTQSPYWTRTDNDNVWTLKCWLALGDTTKHTFTLQVADEITDENDNVKASQLSAIITQIIPKAYKLVDYYHDPTTDTEGMSIGKFATDANLLDVDMPALFRDTTTMGETITDEPYFSLDTTAQSGTDHDLYAAITALGWQNDVIV